MAMRHLLIFALLLTGCSPPKEPPYPTTRPTTNVARPTDIIVLSTAHEETEEGVIEWEVQDAGPYRLYASNLPYHLIGTARLQGGDLLRFVAQGGFIYAQYEGEYERGSFVVPVQEGVDYFWTRTVWEP